MREEVDIVTPVERAIARLSATGVDFFDVFSSCSRSLKTKVMGRGIVDVNSIIDVGVGVRVFKDKGMGSASSQSLDLSDIEETVKKAVAYANVAQPDPYFKGMPTPSRAPKVTDLCDDEVKNLNPLDVGKLTKKMIEATREVRQGAMMSGGVDTSRFKTYLVTSTGVDIEDQRTMVGAFLSVTYKEGEDVGSSSEFEYGISVPEIDFAKIGKKAARKAVEQFGSKKVESATLPLVIAPDPASTLLFGLAGAISGEAAVKGRTFASGLLGKQISQDFLTVVDDGTIPGAVGSDTYDGEGIPTRRLTILDRGVLREFLHNSYSAGIAGVKTNAHAQRGGYGISVGAGPTNLLVRPGDCSKDEMIADTRRGVLVTGAMLYPNPVTGEFSSTLDEGFLIENGEKGHPVKNLMAGGHLLELYRGVDMISKEGRTYGRGHFVPYVRVSGVRLSGN